MAQSLARILAQYVKAGGERGEHARCHGQQDRRADVPGIEARHVAAPMREELRLMADWLGLGHLALPRTGALGREWSRMR